MIATLVDKARQDFPVSFIGATGINWLNHSTDNMFRYTFVKWILARVLIERERSIRRNLNSGIYWFQSSVFLSRSAASVARYRYGASSESRRWRHFGTRVIRAGGNKDAVREAKEGRYCASVRFDAMCNVKRGCNVKRNRAYLLPRLTARICIPISVKSVTRRGNSRCNAGNAANIRLRGNKDYD